MLRAHPFTSRLLLFVVTARGAFVIDVMWRLIRLNYKSLISIHLERDERRKEFVT